MSGKVTESCVACLRVFSAFIRMSAAFRISALESIRSSSLYAFVLFRRSSYLRIRRRQQMRDGVGVVSQQNFLARIGAKEAALFFDQMAQQEHAQTHLDRVVLVGAGDMDVRAACDEPADEDLN